jgi:hypothetical protein
MKRISFSLALLVGLFLLAICSSIIATHAQAQDVPTLKRLMTRSTGTVDGVTPVKILSPITYQKMVRITNCDATNSLLILERDRGSATPAAAGFDYFDYKCAPGNTITISIEAVAEYWAINSSTDTTTSKYSARPYR